jgi:hypothetical protein
MRTHRSAATLALTIATSFGIAMAMPAAAHADPIKEAIPGDPNCVGMLTDYVTHGLPTQYLTARGIGNVAAVNGATVTDVHNLIDAYCAG